MSELEQNKDNFDDLLNFDFGKHLITNKRLVARYVRDDISVSLSNTGFFSFYKEVPVGLLDIGSKGILISTNKKMNINRKIILSLKFATGKTFVIRGRFVYKLGKSFYRYGIKFDHYHNELGDYLLETQSKLRLK